jgi:hypothetical protein
MTVGRLARVPIGTDGAFLKIVDLFMASRSCERVTK